MINFWDKEYALGNIYKNSFDEIINSDAMKAARVSFMSGKYPEQCAKCKYLDETGVMTLRDSSLKYLDSNTINAAIENTDSTGYIDPKFFKLLRWDFRFSNTCNFGCRMCNENNSSYLALETSSDKSRVFSYFNNQAVNDNLIQTKILESNVINFAGGEPMFMREHWKILDTLIEHNKTDVKLTYDINASTLSYGSKHAIDYWKQFKDVYVSCSIDAIGSRAEYIRYGTKWDAVEKTLTEVHSYFGKLIISCVVTIYNVFYLKELFSYFNEHFPNTLIKLKLCFGPTWLSPRILADDVIDSVCSIYNNLDVTQYKNIKIQGLDIFINRFDSSSLNEHVKIKNRRLLVEHTRRFDILRGQDFRTSIPILKEIINE
jgi:uncharacterized Fe-S cluster-containing radical SAM superfamily protein